MPEKKRTASGALGGLLGLVGLSAIAGVLITATVTPAIAVTGAAAKSAITMFDNLPSVLEIDTLMEPTTLWAQNGDGEGYSEITQFYEQNRQIVEFDEIAPVMYDALLSSEDPRYYEHGGVDLIGTTRALINNARGGATQGGSSISQQYVKNILIQRCEATATADDEMTADEAKQQCFIEATQSSGTEGIERKLQEMRYAIALEQQYSKNEILLGYLNIVNLGGTTYGIEAAAQRYFNTTAADLTLGQAATLAGIVQNPNTYRLDYPDSETNGAPDGSVDYDSASVSLAALDTLLENGEITDEQYLNAADGYTETKGRQLYVLSRMLDDGKITYDQYVEAAIEPITPEITSPKTGCAATGDVAYFCQYVVEVIKNDPAFGETADDRLLTLRRGGLNIYTTLDWNIQNAAGSTMNQYAPSSIETMGFGATTVSVEVGTGRVLSIAQNTTFSEDASLADDPNYSSLVYAGDTTYGGSGGFAAGSTFKLFTLIDWLEQGHSVNEVLNGRLRVIEHLTNSCDGDFTNTTDTLVNNFGNSGGYVGTPMNFTRDSLNTGFFAMAEQLDLCDIKNDATKMGVTQADGSEVEMTSVPSIIGTNPVSPLAMAEAYATVASGGIYCQPQIIDNVTDAEGNDLPDMIPERTCERVLSEDVANTAAYALQGVMASGGTGSAGNPNDGTPLIGKTGTHESYHTWMIESSTNVTTAAWVGNPKADDGDLFHSYFNGMTLSNLRYTLARSSQAAADAQYGGDAFPDPADNLIRTVYADLPSVIGMTIDDATNTLEEAGFQVNVGDAVDATESEGTIVSQTPSAGQAAGGSVVTISPSNGQGVQVPNVSGTVQDAQSTLQASGLNAELGTCVDNDSDTTKVTSTSPAAGAVVSRGDTIAINYRGDCDNSGSSDKNNNSNNGNSGGDD